MANSASLTEVTTAINCDFHIKTIDQVNHFKWLTNDHTRHFTAKIGFDSAVVDSDVAFS